MKENNYIVGLRHWVRRKILTKFTFLLITNQRPLSKCWEKNVCLFGLFVENLHYKKFKPCVHWGLGLALFFTHDAISWVTSPLLIHTQVSIWYYLRLLYILEKKKETPLLAPCRTCLLFFTHKSCSDICRLKGYT